MMRCILLVLLAAMQPKVGFAENILNQQYAQSVVRSCASFKGKSVSLFSEPLAQPSKKQMDYLIYLVNKLDTIGSSSVGKKFFDLLKNHMSPREIQQSEEILGLNPMSLLERLNGYCLLKDYEIDSFALRSAISKRAFDELSLQFQVLKEIVNLALSRKSNGVLVDVNRNIEIQKIGAEFFVVWGMERSAEINFHRLDQRDSIPEWSNGHINIWSWMEDDWSKRVLESVSIGAPFTFEGTLYTRK